DAAERAGQRVAGGKSDDRRRRGGDAGDDEEEGKPESHVGSPSAGRTAQNVVPRSSDASSQTLPPCASAIQRAIGSPRPAPLPPARKKRSKIFSCSSGAIPRPLSQTSMRRSPSSPLQRTVTSPPDGASLMAFS